MRLAEEKISEGYLSTCIALYSGNLWNGKEASNQSSQIKQYCESLLPRFLNYPDRREKQ
jgi:hypothetical protein